MTSKGFLYPVPKTKKEQMTHPKQLPDSTIENLRQPWYASFYLIILSIGSIFHFSFLGPNFISYSFIFNLEVTLKYIHKYHSHIIIRMILLSLLHVLSSASSRFLTCTGGTSNHLLNSRYIYLHSFHHLSI